MNYFSSLESMSKKYDKISRAYALRDDSTEIFSKWQRETRKKLIRLIGLEGCGKSSLNAKMRWKEKREGYWKESWMIQTEPEIYMPFYILKPIDVQNIPDSPALIIPHGHGTNGKEGMVTEDPPGFAVSFARKGYCVFCPDGRGDGERREFPQQENSENRQLLNSHREIQQMALGFGQCYLGLMIWDLMRLLDFIDSLSYVDHNRIGCAGMSGGGQLTIWLAALDERVQAAATSGYFYGMKESLLELPQNCSCNYVPGLWGAVDMGDIGALICPRPLWIESGEKDPLNGKHGMKNVYSQVQITRRAYKLSDQEDRLKHVVHSGAHEWRGQGLIDFFDDFLKDGRL